MVAKVNETLYTERGAFMNSVDTESLLFEEKDRIYNMLSQIAESLSESFFHSAWATPEGAEPADCDVLQHVLDCTRALLHAEKCALFLVDMPGTSLVLERVSGEVDFAKLKDVATYDLRATGPGSGVTPWVFRRRSPFNAKNFDELVYRSEGHWKGNWDSPMYGGSGEARARFQCLYMVPLLAGQRAIGVLKYENRTSGKMFYDKQDERLIDLISALVTNLVISQRIERNRYDHILPIISGALVSHLDKPSLYEELLETCRRVLSADMCSLFLLNDQGNLALECIAGVAPEKKTELAGFAYENYRAARGLTPWILRRRMSFNVRSYPDLRGRSENQHLGSWDRIIYDGIPEKLFKSLYSVPLIIGDEPIGVFKVENKNIPPYYFTESDERLFDLIGRLIAVGVRYAKARKNEQFLMQMARSAELGFLAASISHEFDGYLNSFIARARCAALACHEDAVRTELDQIVSSVLDASKIINIFRNMRTTSRGATAFSIKEFVETIVVISRARFLAHQIQLSHSVEGVDVIKLNAGELQSILINLLNNAFSSAIRVKGPREVKVRVTPEQDTHFAIEVADSGLGISKEQLPLLFVPFYSTNPEGMGIGLYVVQRLVTQMKGKIEVEGKNRLGGATFRVVLPLSVDEEEMQ